MRDGSDENPARLRSELAATAPVDVVSLLGGVAKVCRHLSFLIGLWSLGESLGQRTGDDGGVASLLC